MEKAKLFVIYLINLPTLIKFREFFLYFYDIFIDLKNIPQNKKYLINKQHGFVGGYCSRQFISYTPKLVKDNIEKQTKELFRDKKSAELYLKVFNRHLYSSLLLPGWSEYFEKEIIFKKLLKQIFLKIKSKTIFEGNYLTVKNQNVPYCLEFLGGPKYFLPKNWFEISVFCFDLGLVYLTKRQLKYLKSRHIVDAGAYIGDSSIVLARYTDKKVYAFEPSLENFELLNKTINLNNVKDKIVPCMVALDSKVGTTGLLGAGAGARVTAQSKVKIKTHTLDSYLTNRDSKIGLIKMDVEGYEMNILLGCRKIILTDHPIMLLSIYHSAEQYLDIPRYMKNNYGDIYNFTFIDCNPVHPLAEKVLLCLPKNL